jgi:murein DD-endopeptidase MepM/ murein hydrolase activator NlpD
MAPFATLWAVVGTRASHVGLIVALLAAAIPVVVAPPAIANDPESCEPYTRSEMYSDVGFGQTTTTAGVIDLIGDSRARGATDVEEPEPTVGPDPEPAQPRGPSCDFVKDIEYPLLGAGSYGSSFGAVRAGGARRHLGIDIMAPQMTPVVAAADGVVIRIELGGRLAGTYIALLHDDGWETWYIHLNNDSFGTDDGRGIGVRPDLAVGDRVAAGELIGWVGDSGNAETTAPHLHFELHLPDGEPIDPWPSVSAAEERSATAFAETRDPDELAQIIEDGSIQLFSARLEAATLRPGFDGPYIDDDGTEAEEVFGTLTALGVPVWCDEWGVRVCPDDPLTGAAAESWIGGVYGSGRDPSVAIAYEGTTIDPGLDRSTDGCGVSRLCEDQPVTFGEAAAMIIGVQDGVSVLAPSEAAARLVAGGLTGCGPQNPDRQMTRGEFAALMLRSTGGDVPCADVS